MNLMEMDLNDIPKMEPNQLGQEENNLGQEDEGRMSIVLLGENQTPLPSGNSVQGNMNVAQDPNDQNSEAENEGIIIGLSVQPLENNQEEEGENQANEGFFLPEDLLQEINIPNQFAPIGSRWL
jgi:hypothetical protein